MTGIEPAPSVWKTEALPLSYIPAGNFFSLDVSASADYRFSKDGEPARLYVVVSPGVAFQAVPRKGGMCRAIGA
jgi:hypothetical protein